MSADGRGGFVFGNQARRDAGSLEQRLENLALWGKVAEVNDEGAGKVRVRFGAVDNTGKAVHILSPWLPIAHPPSCAEGHWSIPNKEDLVLVVSTSGVLENGVVVATVPYRDDIEDKGYPHAAKSKSDDRIIWGKVKKLKDLVLNCFRNFNKANHIWWHFLKSGGKFRFEVGGNAVTSTYAQIEDGKIEFRVGATKLTIGAAGIQGFYSGSAASFAFDQDGFTVALRNAPAYAQVPADAYGHTTGTPAGGGVQQNNGVVQTTFRIRNGSFECTMDDKAQLLMTPGQIVSTLKGRAQHVITQSLIESTVWKEGTKDISSSVMVLAEAVDLEVRNKDGRQIRASLVNTGQGEIALLIGNSRFVLQPEAFDLRIPGVSLTFSPELMSALAPEYLFQQGAAEGSDFTPGKAADGERTMKTHKNVTVPADLPRPNIEIGVKPFTPEYQEKNPA